MKKKIPEYFCFFLNALRHPQEQIHLPKKSYTEKIYFLPINAVNIMKLNHCLQTKSTVLGEAGNKFA